MIPNWA